MWEDGPTPRRKDEPPMSTPTAELPTLPPPPDGPQAALDPAPRRRWIVPMAIVAALALIAGGAWFAINGGESAEAQPLALSFTQGQERSYEIHTTMDAHMSSD